MRRRNLKSWNRTLVLFKWEPNTLLALDVMISSDRSYGLHCMTEMNSKHECSFVIDKIMLVYPPTARLPKKSDSIRSCPRRSEMILKGPVQRVRDIRSRF